MKKTMMVLSLVMSFSGSAFANSAVDSAVMSALDAKVNNECSPCAGDYESCCSRCPKTCNSLKELDLSFIKDPGTGALKVIPARR